MDTQKDIQKTDVLTKFIEHDVLKTSPFGENRFGEKAYRRAERMASAIILLTNHISDIDVLKKHARELSVKLLSDVISIKDEMRSSNSELGRELKFTIRQLVSALRLLAISGSVSFQNADSVSEALDELSSFLNSSRRSVLSESISISKDELLDLRDSQPTLSDAKTHERLPRATGDIKDNPQNSGVSYDSSHEDKVLSARSKTVVEILRLHGEMGIRDIASNLPEFSEKMIQRELARLVTLGAVKKTGLKRWSRYGYIPKK